MLVLPYILGFCLQLGGAGSIGPSVQPQHTVPTWPSYSGATAAEAMSAEQVYHMYAKLWEFLFFAGFIIRGLQWISALTSCLTHLSSECAIQRKVLSFKSRSQFSCFNHYIKTLSSCLCAGLLQCGNAECPECESVCTSW